MCIDFSWVYCKYSMSFLFVHRCTISIITCLQRYVSRNAWEMDQSIEHHLLKQAIAGVLHGTAVNTHHDIILYYYIWKNISRYLKILEILGEHLSHVHLRNLLSLLTRSALVAMVRWKWGRATNGAARSVEAKPPFWTSSLAKDLFHCAVTKNMDGRWSNWLKSNVEFRGHWDWVQIEKLSL